MEGRLEGPGALGWDCSYGRSLGAFGAVLAPGVLKIWPQAEEGLRAQVMSRGFSNPPNLTGCVASEKGEQVLKREEIPGLCWAQGAWPGPPLQPGLWGHGQLLGRRRGQRVLKVPRRCLWWGMAGDRAAAGGGRVAQRMGSLFPQEVRLLPALRSEEWVGLTQLQVLHAARPAPARPSGTFPPPSPSTGLPSTGTGYHQPCPSSCPGRGWALAGFWGKALHTCAGLSPAGWDAVKPGTAAD